MNLMVFALVITAFMCYKFYRTNEKKNILIKQLEEQIKDKEIDANNNIRILAEHKQKLWDDSRKECLQTKRDLEKQFEIRNKELSTEYENKSFELAKIREEVSEIYKQRDLILKDAQSILNDATYEAEGVKKEAVKIKHDILFEKIELEKKYKEKLHDLECLRNELTFKVKDMPVLATYIAELEAQKVAISELHLFYKDNPAIKASEVVGQIKQERHDLVKRLKLAQYKALYYEQVVPWLVELDEEPLNGQDEVQDVFNKENSKDDEVGYWLTDNEYNSLNVIERNQRALERYRKRNKTKLEIGLDFERFVGYTYEKNGYDVQYRGIIDGLEDMGRDLICFKGKEVKVIQCKYWSNKKVIHENHINQLFGTTLKLYLERNPQATFFDFSYALQFKEIVPVLITSTLLSETAKQFAEALCVEVVEDFKMDEYPMIKCNVNRRTGEKIYHLPFDQQYDKVKIDGEGEFYAMTVQEAEDKGFRRAKKWVGNS